MVKVVYIDSFNRTSGTNEDFTIRSDARPFEGVPKKVKLLNASIPSTFFNNVTDGNNTITLNQGNTLTYNFLIPIGKYSESELAVEVQTQLSRPALAPDITVVWDRITRKYEFESDSNNGIQLIFDDTGSIADLLGFDAGSTNPPTGPVNTPFESTKVVNVSLENELFICSDLVAGSDNGIIPWTSSPLQSPYSQNQIISRIPSHNNVNNVIHYTANPSLPFFDCSQSKFGSTSSEETSIRFFLRFSSGGPIGLNGEDWTAALLFDFE